MPRTRFGEGWLDLASSSGACGCVLLEIDFSGQIFRVSNKDVIIENMDGSMTCFFQGCLISEITLSETLDPVDRSSSSKGFGFEVPLEVVPALELRKKRTILQDGIVRAWWIASGVAMTLRDALFFLEGAVSSVVPDVEKGTVTFEVVEKRLKGDRPFPPAMMDGVRLTGIADSEKGKVSPIVVGSVKAHPGLDTGNLTSWIIMHDPFRRWVLTDPTVTDAYEEETDAGGFTQSRVTDAIDGSLHQVVVLNNPATNRTVNFDLEGYPATDFVSLIEFLLRFSDHSSKFDRDSLKDAGRFFEGCTFNIVFNERVEGGVIAILRERLGAELPFLLVQRGDLYEFRYLEWDRNVVKILSFDKNIIRAVEPPSETPKENIYSNISVSYSHSLLRDETLGAIERTPLNDRGCWLAEQYYGANTLPTHEARDLDAAGAELLSKWLVETHGRMRLSVSYECSLEAAALDLWDTVLVHDAENGMELGAHFKVVGLHLGCGPTVVVDLLSIDDLHEIYREEVIVEPTPIITKATMGDYYIDVEFNVPMADDGELDKVANWTIWGTVATPTIESVTILTTTSVRVTLVQYADSIDDGATCSIGVDNVSSA